MEILKPSWGDGDKTLTYGLTVTDEDGTEYTYEDFSVTVSQKELTADIANRLFASAVDEIEQSFFGSNENAKSIQGDLNLKNSYSDGKVTAEWEIEDNEFIDDTGHYKREMAKALESRSEEIRLTAILHCGEYESVYNFYIEVKAPEVGFEEKIRDAVENSINSTSVETVMLPESIKLNGDIYKLDWSEGQNIKIGPLIFALVIFLVFIKYEKKERKKRREGKRKKALKLKYPEIVSEFSLLIGAGMNLTNALKKIAASYKTGSAVGDELAATLAEIENGAGEYNAFYRMGDRIGLREYRRFTSLVTQNIRHGGRRLDELLMQEAESAYEERRNNAKKYGEEAETKMVLPMFMMLGIVIIITIYPAFSGLTF